MSGIRYITFESDGSVPERRRTLVDEAVSQADVPHERRTPSHDAMQQFFETKLAGPQGGLRFPSRQWLRSDSSEVQVDLRSIPILDWDDGPTLFGTPELDYLDLVEPRITGVPTESAEGRSEPTADQIPLIHHLEAVEELKAMLGESYRTLRDRILDRYQDYYVMKNEVMFTSHGTIERPVEELLEKEQRLFDQIRDGGNLVVVTGWGLDDMGTRIAETLEPKAIISEGGTLLSVDPDATDEWNPEPLYDPVDQWKVVRAYDGLLDGIQRRFQTADGGPPVLHAQGNRVGVCAYVNPAEDELSELQHPAETTLNGSAPAEELAATIESDPAGGQTGARLTAEAESADELRVRLESLPAEDTPVSPRAVVAYETEKLLSNHWTLLPYQLLDRSGEAVTVRLLSANVDVLTDATTDVEQVVNGRSRIRHGPEATYEPDREGVVETLEDIVADTACVPASLAERVEPQDDCCVDVFVNRKRDAVRREVFERLVPDLESLDTVSYVSKGTGSDAPLLEKLNQYDPVEELRVWAPEDAPDRLLEADGVEVNVFDGVTDSVALLGRIVFRGIIGRGGVDAWRVI